MRGHRLFWIAACLALQAVGPEEALAASPSMLLDIYASEVEIPAEAGVSGSFLALGRVALVPVREPSSGTELWVTDGTDAGTRPLLDLCPGPCSTEISFLGVLRGAGIFAASPEGGDLLGRVWRSDGTLPGTFPLVTAGDAPGTFCSAASAVLDAVLLFSMNTGSGCELWRTDGTAAGTARLLDERPQELTAAGVRAFFFVSGGGGWELWRSDGTQAGTVRLEGSRVFPSGPPDLLAAGPRLFFVAPDDGLELWTSDGTAAGTRSLTRFGPAEPFPFRLEFQREKGYVTQFLDGLFYFLADDGSQGRELWRSDGTAAGTRPVTGFAAANPFPGLETWRVEKLGQRLIFAADDGSTGPRLWTTDGRPESTKQIEGCPGHDCPELPQRAELVRLGSRVVLTGDRNGVELWASDGTGAGTRPLLLPSREVSNLLPLLGRVFFVLDPSGDPSLWVTDGTEAGTRPLTPEGHLLYRELPVISADLGDFALFALQQDDSLEVQLWRSDGTPAGTSAVTRIGRNGLSSSPRSLVPAGDAVRFLANDEERGGGIWTSRGTAATTSSVAPVLSSGRLIPLGNLTFLFDLGDLWRSDGTREGTFRLVGTGRVRHVAALPGRVVFGTVDSEEGVEIWVSDGSLAGTRKIFDLPAEEEFLTDLAGAGAEAFFVTTTSSHEDRLWVTDGTAAGTRPLTRLEAPSIDPTLQVARLGSLVLFAGSSRLWRTDGTATGTFPVADGVLKEARQFFVHHGRLYLLASSAEPPYLLGIWSSDGTDAGTVLLRALPSSQSTAVELVPLGDHLFFAFTDEKGNELWRTDGTPQGTVPVRDLLPGGGSSFPRDLTVLGDRLYFAARDEKHGIELWESDGTFRGTRFVQDIAPGPFSSAPQELTVAGGRLYFTADDGVHGREPWVYAPGGAACVPSDTVLCLGGGRFKVEADWRDFEGGNGRGHAVSLTPDTGYFWFFDQANVEVILKVLDGQGVNGHQWVFYGALSNVEYVLTVTDTQTGAARRYFNPPGRLGSVADTAAFGPLGASVPGQVTLGPAPVIGEAVVAARTAPATGSCTPSATRLCLNGGRFAVEARWKDFQGTTGTGKAVPLSGGDTGYFWFFDAGNVEVVLKVLDGRPLNNKFWVFYGALSNVEYTLTVTDTVTGAVKTYTNPSGRLASVADTNAF